MKRKVVKHGSSFIISLPNKWVKEYGVKKGDELHVAEKGRTLWVNPKEVRSKLEISEDVSDLAPRLVDRFLVRCYQKGYDKIKLIHNDLELLEKIRTKVHELMGFEVVEQNEKSCVIQSIAQNIDLDFDNSLRKAFIITQGMLETCYEAYKKGDKRTLENLYLRDLETNKFCFFCLRQINKRQYVGPESSHQMQVLYYLIERLEACGDCFRDLSSLLSKTKKINKDILKILELLIKQDKASFSYFYKASKEKANEAYDLFWKVRTEVARVSGKSLSREEILSLFWISEASIILYHIVSMRLDFLK